ncbi:hypothetical protein P167DRAFT_580149 [Morchella conica CCBAS932]|uniref:Uncharacterized protein n=1 Tax=Morchella conica CCBAS932 TaxID=1392247 RepID=A0A3N4KB71_9PEZI|nr:hypothetical protein P167DRAFT_580149 [Morchella conica CCBAS932]
MSTSRMELMVALKGGVLEVAVTSLFTEIAETSPSLTRSLLAEGIPALKMAGTTFFVGDTQANPAVAIWSSLRWRSIQFGSQPFLNRNHNGSRRNGENFVVVKSELQPSHPSVPCQMEKGSSSHWQAIGYQHHWDANQILKYREGGTVLELNMEGDVRIESARVESAQDPNERDEGELEDVERNYHGADEEDE